MMKPPKKAPDEKAMQELGEDELDAVTGGEDEIRYPKPTSSSTTVRSPKDDYPY